MPIVGLIMVGVVAALFTLWGDIGQIADVTNFALFVAFVLVNLALIELRRSRPDAVRPFRSPGTLPCALVGQRWARIPVLPVLGVVSIIVLMANLDLESLLGGLVLLAIGIGLAFVRPHWGGKAADDSGP